MRQLLYIPMVHDEVDMGSAGAPLAQKSAALSGEWRWRLHQETVCKFWESVSSHLLSFDVHRLRVYQDGLAADGAMGRRIVEAAAERGSKNYRLVLELLHRGAELRKTEDPVLLWQERENILSLAQQEPAWQESCNAHQYRLRRDCLTEKRDRFMAETIGATLREGEVGVLFIGAYHNVASHLAGDISVEAARDPDQVRTYFNELFLGHDDVRLEELAQYLSSPVGTPQQH